MDIAVYAIFLLGALARYVFGFGEALVTTPLLLLVSFNTNNAIAMIGILGLALALPAAIKNYQAIDFHLIKHLVFGAILGVPLGLIFLHYGNTYMLKVLMGIFLVLYGLINLIGIRIAKGHLRVPTLLVGIVSGFLGGAINTHGAPVAMYGQAANWPDKYLRANLQTYFGIVGLVIVFGQGATGLWNTTVFKDLLFLVPGVVAVLIVSEILLRRINTTTLNKYLYGFFVIVGGLMFF